MSTVLGALVDMTRPDYDAVARTEDAGHTGRRVTNAPAPSFTVWDQQLTDPTDRGWQP